MYSEDKDLAETHAKVEGQTKYEDIHYREKEIVKQKKQLRSDKTFNSIFLDPGPELVQSFSILYNMPAALSKSSSSLSEIFPLSPLSKIESKKTELATILTHEITRLPPLLPFPLEVIAMRIL